MVLGWRMRCSGCHSRRIATFPAKENATIRGADGGPKGKNSNVVCMRGQGAGGGRAKLFVYLCYQRLSATLWHPSDVPGVLKCVPIGGNLSYAEHGLTMPAEPGGRREKGCGTGSRCKETHDCSRCKAVKQTLQLLQELWSDNNQRIRIWILDISGVKG